LFPEEAVSRRCTQVAADFEKCLKSCFPNDFTPELFTPEIREARLCGALCCAEHG
jgi:hypothetical protein